jgi:hypothetical protein
MAKQATCHTCIYAYWDRGLWLRTLWSGFPARPTCANQADTPGQLRECPCGPACRNYRPKPPVPTGPNVKMIPLTQGFYTYVDAEDFEWLNRYHWHAYNGYASRCDGSGRIYMHREIMKTPKGMVVDHINGNGFDNTRANIRNVTRGENMHNQRKHAGTASIYKGVTRGQSSKGSWCARAAWGDHRLTAGTFASEVEAARAYDRLAVELFGEHARVNFPEEWPPGRRAQVYADAQPKRAALLAKAAQAKRRKSKERRKAAGKKPRTAKCRQKPATKARVKKARKVRKE